MGRPKSKTETPRYALIGITTYSHNARPPGNVTGIAGVIISGTVTVAISSTVPGLSSTLDFIPGTHSGIRTATTTATVPTPTCTTPIYTTTIPVITIPTVPRTKNITAQTMTM